MSGIEGNSRKGGGRGEARETCKLHTYNYISGRQVFDPLGMMKTEKQMTVETDDTVVKRQE
jgi:hypothetical protein